MAKQTKMYGPCSMKQKQFLDSECTLVIYGGGK
jgi:hypothetical protein